MIRRFIRLNEVEQKTPFTSGDVLSLIENGELSYSALLDLSTLGALKKNSDKNVAISAFNYQGIVGLTKNDSRKIAIRGEIPPITLFLVKEVESICDWKPIPTFFGFFDGSRVEYEAKSPSVPDKAFWAMGQLEIGQSWGQITNNFFAGLAKEMSKHHPQKPDVPFSEDERRYLQVAPVRLTRDCLRVDLHELANLLKKPNQADNIEERGVCSVVETNPIKLIINRVLSENPSLNSRQIWNLVREDSSKNRRQFDIDSLIFDMSGEELHYFGLGDTTYKQSYRRFQNLVSEVRKKLHG